VWPAIVAITQAIARYYSSVLLRSPTVIAASPNSLADRREPAALNVHPVNFNAIERVRETICVEADSS
jgi:hypothetical protein